jgi:hypothetical protein
MISVMQLAVLVVCSGILLLLLVFVLLPWLRLELRRRQSQGVRPEAEQIWMQDGDLIYIDYVDRTGVGIIAYSAAGGANKWKDTWPEWQQRCRYRSMWFTGQKRPLGKA